MTLKEQVEQAIQIVKQLFDNAEPAPPIPEGMTLEKLWVLYNKKRHNTIPGVEQVVKILLEDPNLDAIPIPVIAEIIREVFKVYGVKCNCSERSVRWYQSQRNLQWTIVRRKPYKIEV
jgi:hypothetical protein